MSKSRARTSHGLLNCFFYVSVTDFSLPQLVSRIVIRNVVDLTRVSWLQRQKKNGTRLIYIFTWR
jgi:hypothetical protein